MSDTETGLIVVAIIVAIAVPLYYFLVWRPKKQGSSKHLNDGINWRAVVPGNCPTDDRVHQLTNLGINIYSATGKPQSLLDEADAAYTFEKERAKSEGRYRTFPDPSVIDIRFPKAGCQPSPEMHVPSFLIRLGRDYEAGEFDQHYDKRYDPPQNRDGVLYYSEPDDCAVGYVAELLTGLSTPGSTPPRDSAVCCDGIFYEGVRNFLQHCFIGHNDGAWFATTSAAGHVHPLEYRPLLSELVAGVRPQASFTNAIYKAVK